MTRKLLTERHREERDIFQQLQELIDPLGPVFDVIHPLEKSGLALFPRHMGFFEAQALLIAVVTDCLSMFTLGGAESMRVYSRHLWPSPLRVNEPFKEFTQCSRAVAFLRPSKRS